MALFVFGAGATRGCSFVQPTKFPCLPPLDRDFFTQLQRVSNPKHHELIGSVMEDVVDLFGPNFDATMETVFTTLEHSIRMVKATGRSTVFSLGQLESMRERLKQAIAAVLEEALTENDDGEPSRRPRTCERHKRFVTEILRQYDSIISFNYDCVLDFALKENGNKRWNAHYGYGHTLGPGGSGVAGHEFWQPPRRTDRKRSVRLFKLHGSLHFRVDGTGDATVVTLKQRPYTKQAGNGLRFEIIPPEWNKAFDSKVFGPLWTKASEAIQKAQHIAVIGYSLPLADLHSTALFRTSVKPRKIRSLVVVNPDREARRRIRSVLQRGLTPESLVLSFDYFEDFLAAKRTLWVR